MKKKGREKKRINGKKKKKKIKQQSFNSIFLFLTTTSISLSPFSHHPETMRQHLNHSKGNDSIAFLWYWQMRLWGGYTKGKGDKQV